MPLKSADRSSEQQAGIEKICAGRQPIEDEVGAMASALTLSSTSDVGPRLPGRSLGVRGSAYYTKV